MAPSPSHCSALKSRDVVDPQSQCGIGKVGHGLYSLYLSVCIENTKDALFSEWRLVKMGIL